MRFEERGDAADIIVIHERIPDETTRGWHEQGWMGCLDGLVKYFSGR